MNRITLGDGSHEIVRGTTEDGTHVIGIRKMEESKFPGTWASNTAKKVHSDSMDMLILFKTPESIQAMKVQIAILEVEFSLSQQKQQ